MQQNQKKTVPDGGLVFCMMVLNAIVMEQGLVTSSGWYLLLFITIPFLVASIFSLKHKQS